MKCISILWALLLYLCIAGVAAWASVEFTDHHNPLGIGLVMKWMACVVVRTYRKGVVGCQNEKMRLSEGLGGPTQNQVWHTWCWSATGMMCGGRKNVCKFDMVVTVGGGWEWEIDRRWGFWPAKWKTELCGLSFGPDCTNPSTNHRGSVGTWGWGWCNIEDDIKLHCGNWVGDTISPNNVLTLYYIHLSFCVHKMQCHPIWARGKLLSKMPINRFLGWKGENSCTNLTKLTSTKLHSWNSVYTYLEYVHTIVKCGAAVVRANKGEKAKMAVQV